eukprot:Opistho-2@30765
MDDLLFLGQEARGEDTTHARRVIDRLKEAWRNEKSAPELLQYEEELVALLLAEVAAQDDVVTQRQENVAEAFFGNLLQMEVDRVKFVLRSYLRTRLRKIEKHAFHVLKHRDERTKLSEHELKFTRDLVDEMARHVMASALDRFPAQFRKLDDEISPEGSMVTAPNMDAFVFVRVLETQGNFALGDADVTVDLERGDLYICRYDPIRPLLHEGKVALL